MFTFGSGQYGQLGHNSFRDELRPRLVAELLGTMVSEIACGQYSISPFINHFVSFEWLFQFLFLPLTTKKEELKFLSA